MKLLTQFLVVVVLFLAAGGCGKKNSGAPAVPESDAVQRDHLRPGGRGAGLTGRFHNGPNYLNLEQDELGQLLRIIISEPTVQANGTLRRVSFDLYEGQVFSTSQGCTVGFDVSYRILSVDSVEVTSNHSDGHCGVSVNPNIHYVLQRVF